MWENGHLMNGGARLAGHLGPLAELAIPAPASDVCGHTHPHPPGQHEALGDLDAQMG